MSNTRQQAVNKELLTDILYASKGKPVDAVIAVLFTLLRTLLVGTTWDNKMAIDLFDSLANQMKGDLAAEKPNEFGFMLDDTQDGLPIFNKIGRNNNEEA